MNTTASGTIKSLQLIHRAILFGQVIFAAIAYMLKDSGKFEASLRDMDQQLQVIAILLSFGCVVGGSLVFKRKIQAARDTEHMIHKKASVYKTATIIQWALLEGASLFGIICFMLVGNLSFIFLSGGLIFFFALMAPSRLKAMLLLRLTGEDMEQF